MKHKRFIFGCILFLLLLLLMAYYNLKHNNHNPDTQYILDHFVLFNGTKITMSGVVTNMDNTHHTLRPQV